jgi:signal transduction histidine kinase
MTSKRPKLPPLLRGLSARLLILTVFFVMLAEVFIYAPSIGRYRLTYLEEKLSAAHLAILTLEAAPDFMVSPQLQHELLTHVGARSIAFSKPDGGKLMLMEDSVAPVDETFDLDDPGFFRLIGDAFMVLTSRGDRLIRVMGSSPKDPKAMLEVVMNQSPLREAMLGFSQRILALSLIISLVTAALVYLSLQWLMVMPMRRITESMIAFRRDPEDAHNMIRPSLERSDEIGVAQRELARMQEGLRDTLTQKTRLAALGTAVSKITHDLKNILATARLVSDRLSDSSDPEVKRVAPTLLKAIDRAVSLCLQTLDYASERTPRPVFDSFSLAELAEEVGAGLLVDETQRREWLSEIPAGLAVEADREQLFRVLHNLGRNAYEAGAGRVSLTTREEGERLFLELRDDGPGLAPRARENLFKPFESSARQGGAGLGLCIANDLVRAHGGRLSLLSSGAEGTCFVIELPLSGAKRRENAA